MQKRKNLCSRYRKNRKANAVADSLLVIVLLFVLVIGVLFGNYLFDVLDADLQADPTISAEAKAMSSDHHTRYPGFFDAIFALVFFLLWGMVIIASFKLDTHPIFFIFTLILIIFVLFVGAELANVYDDVIASDPELATISDQYTIADWIFNHYLLVALAIGFSIILVLFGKNRILGG